MNKALQLVTKNPTITSALNLKNKVYGNIKATNFYKELDSTINSHFDSSGQFGMENRTES